MALKTLEKTGEELKNLVIDGTSYNVTLCFLREPAGVVNRRGLSTTCYRGFYRIQDKSGREGFVVIDDFLISDTSRLAVPRSRIANNLFDLFG
jgi:hypothetical protein